ncbi:MAG: glycosyltransferase family 4 protein [bacterium]
MKKKITVGLITDTFLPQIGGAEVHVKYLARFLNKSYNIKIYTSTPGESQYDNIQVVRSKSTGNKLFKFFSDFKDLFFFIKSVDLVHAHYTYYLSFISGLLSKALRRPFVVTLHGLGTLDSSVDKNFIRKIFRFCSFKLSDAVIATSQEMADVAKRFVNIKKIHIVTNGVDTNFFTPEGKKVEGDKKIILSVRRLTPKNGVQYLVESAPSIIQRVEDAEIWITCKDKLEKYLRERVKQLNIQKYVKFIGEIDNEKLPNIYNKADVVVFPSSAESTSIACLEAMSCGNAIVASALSVYKEMIGENERGILVELFSRDYSDYNAPMCISDERIRKLSDAIVNLCNDSQLRKNCGEKARLYAVQNYDWVVITKQIKDIYGELIDH